MHKKIITVKLWGPELRCTTCTMKNLALHAAAGRLQPVSCLMLRRPPLTVNV